MKIGDTVSPMCNIILEMNSVHINKVNSVIQGVPKKRLSDQYG